MRFLLSLIVISTAFSYAAEGEKKPEATEEPRVFRMFAESITKDGEFTLVRCANAEVQMIVRGGIKLVNVDGRVEVWMKDCTTVRSNDPISPLAFMSEGKGTPADEYVVIVGKGDRMVDFKPAAGAGGKVECREVRVTLLDRLAPHIVALPDTPLEELGEAVSKAAPK